MKNKLYLCEDLEDNEVEMKELCCICHKPIKGYGNNAEPVCSGRCCDKCNYEVVIPARIDAFRKTAKNESLTEDLEEEKSAEEKEQEAKKDEMVEEVSDEEIEEIKEKSEEEAPESEEAAEEEVEEKTEESDPSTPSDLDTAIASMLGNAIIRTWEAIDNLNSIMVSVKTENEDHPIISIIQAIVDDEMMHVGQLEQAMQHVDPASENIEQGKAELEAPEEEISEEEPTEEAEGEGVALNDLPDEEVVEVEEEEEEKGKETPVRESYIQPVQPVAMDDEPFYDGPVEEFNC